MSARPPDTIVVGPHSYALRFAPLVADDEDLFGHADHRAATIVCRTNMSRSQQQDTVLHEVLHCALVQTTHDNEKLVWQLAPILLDTLQRNPQLVRYLTT